MLPTLLGHPIARGQPSLASPDNQGLDPLHTLPLILVWSVEAAIFLLKLPRAKVTRGLLCSQTPTISAQLRPPMAQSSEGWRRPVPSHPRRSGFQAVTNV